MTSKEILDDIYANAGLPKRIKDFIEEEWQRQDESVITNPHLLELAALKGTLELLKADVEGRKWVDDNNGVEALFSIDAIETHIADIETVFERDDAIKMLNE